jgi:hypothetical protein
MNKIASIFLAAVMATTPACAAKKEPFKKDLPVKYVLLSEKGETTITQEQYGAIDELNRRNLEFTEEEFIDEVKRGDAEVVKIFLKAGMNPNTKVEKEWPALALASAKGYADVVVALVDAKALVNMKNTNGWTPLMLAVHLGKNEAAKALVDKGADIELTNNNGMTALMLATQQKNIELISFLLKKGGNPRAVSDFGASAANIAVESGQVDVISAFEKGGYKKLIEQTRAEIKAEKKRLAAIEVRKKKAKDEVAPKMPPKMPNDPDDKGDSVQE